MELKPMFQQAHAAEHAVTLAQHIGRNPDDHGKGAKNTQAVTDYTAGFEGVVSFVEIPFFEAGVVISIAFVADRDKHNNHNQCHQSQIYVVSSFSHRSVILIGIIGGIYCKIGHFFFRNQVLASPFRRWFAKS